jgi:hypothetical protein
MVDGSRRVTLRNRRFVRPLNPTLKKPVSTGLQQLEDEPTPGIILVQAQREDTVVPRTLPEMTFSMRWRFLFIKLTLRIIMKYQTLRRDMLIFKEVFL